MLPPVISALSTFVTTLFRSTWTLIWNTSRYGINSPSINRPCVAPGSVRRIGSSGGGAPDCGLAGKVLSVRPATDGDRLAAAAIPVITGGG